MFFYLMYGDTLKDTRFYKIMIVGLFAVSSALAENPAVSPGLDDRADYGKRLWEIKIGTFGPTTTSTDLHLNYRR